MNALASSTYFKICTVYGCRTNLSEVCVEVALSLPSSACLFSTSSNSEISYSKRASRDFRIQGIKDLDIARIGKGRGMGSELATSRKDSAMSVRFPPRSPNLGLCVGLLLENSGFGDFGFSENFGFIFLCELLDCFFQTDLIALSLDCYLQFSFRKTSENYSFYSSKFVFSFSLSVEKKSFSRNFLLTCVYILINHFS